MGSAPACSALFAIPPQLPLAMRYCPAPQLPVIIGASIRAPSRQPPPAGGLPGASARWGGAAQPLRAAAPRSAPAVGLGGWSDSGAGPRAGRQAKVGRVRCDGGAGDVPALREARRGCAFLQRWQWEWRTPCATDQRAAHTVKPSRGSAPWKHGFVPARIGNLPRPMASPHPHAQRRPWKAGERCMRGQTPRHGSAFISTTAH
jgi:hypothetical protein